MFHDLAHHALDCARSVVFTRLVSLAPAVEPGYRVFTRPDSDPGMVFVEHNGVLHAPYVDTPGLAMPPGAQAAVDDLMDFLFVLYLADATPHVSLSAAGAEGPVPASVPALFARRVEAVTAGAYSLADAAYAAKACATGLVVARLVAASSNPDDLVFDDKDLAALWASLFTA